MRSWRVGIGAGLVLACAACSAVPSTAVPSTRPEAVATAQIARSCAPWDGAAFTVSVPVAEGASAAALPALQLSVWSSPQFDGERKIVFAEGDDRSGVAFYAETAERSAPLTGDATFRQAADGSIEGTLRLKGADGRRFERRFRGRLDGRVVMCG